MVTTWHEISQASAVYVTASTRRGTWEIHTWSGGQTVRVYTGPGTMYPIPDDAEFTEAGAWQIPEPAQGSRVFYRAVTKRLTTQEREAS